MRSPIPWNVVVPTKLGSEHETKLVPRAQTIILVAEGLHHRHTSKAQIPPELSLVVEDPAGLLQLSNLASSTTLSTYIVLIISGFLTRFSLSMFMNSRGFGLVFEIMFPTCQSCPPVMTLRGRRVAWSVSGRGRRVCVSVSRLPCRENFGFCYD